MDKEYKLTQQEIEELTQEKKLSEHELITEIFSILKDYFVGVFLDNGKHITYKLLNGQAFKITVQEILK